MIHDYIDPWQSPLSSIALAFPVAASFGGGLNSTALLCRWVREGFWPMHRIWFADTGGERKETMDHIAMFSEWLVAHGMPPVEIIRKGGRPETLEQYALRTKHLPSMAYGKKGCSHKFKIEPQNRETNRWPLARQAWKAGTKVVKLIGYGAEEQKRISKAKLEDEKFFYRFPLDEWGMDRAGCEAEIRAAGLRPPPKSSCFFCPSMTKPEINALPMELKVRAVHIEAIAKEARNLDRNVKGLGRRFAWAEHLAGLPTEDGIVASCMYCVDGPDPEQSA